MNTAEMVLRYGAWPLAEAFEDGDGPIEWDFDHEEMAEDIGYQAIYMAWCQETTTIIFIPSAAWS